jgi:hypothetical protein
MDDTASAAIITQAYAENRSGFTWQFSVDDLGANFDPVSPVRTPPVAVNMQLWMPQADQGLAEQSSTGNILDLYLRATHTSRVHCISDPKGCDAPGDDNPLGDLFVATAINFAGLPVSLGFSPIMLTQLTPPPLASGLGSNQVRHQHNPKPDHVDTYTLRYRKPSSEYYAEFFLEGRHSASAVPEPTSWVIMFMGVGFIGSTMRRRGAAAKNAIASG